MADFDDSSRSSSSMSSEMELSSDDDLEFYEERERPKNQNYFQDTIPRYNEVEFSEHFRVSRPVAENIGHQYEQSQYFNYQSGGNGKLSSFQQVLIYLWFVGHQTASFRDVSDRFDISISTLFVIIRKLTNFLSNLSNQIIKWPSPEEQVEIEGHFRENGFGGVIGAIDGSHVKIDKPTNDPDSYLNRKGFFSIQLQVVCDHRKKIRDLFVGFPGSVHDSRVFRTSPLCNTLPEKCRNYFILGDSGYPCLPHLLTPFKDRGYLTRRQSNFNLLLSQNRYVVEHCYGLLKQKFRQLYHLKLRSVPDMVHFIRACCVLHNLAIDDNFQYEEEEEAIQHVNDLLVDRELDDDQVERDDRNGINRRNQIANLLEI